MAHESKGRIIDIIKQRELEREDFEKKKQQLESDRNIDISERFTSNHEVKPEASLPTDVIGLVNLEEMKKKHKNFLAPDKNDSLVTGRTELKEKEKDKPEKESKIRKNQLSFKFDDEEEEEEVFVLKKKGRLGMDPSADTSFINDPDKDQDSLRERERLAKEWRELQDKEKNEEINVSYCYWDGSSHLKYLRVKKGCTISQFLTKALETLRKEFGELKPANPENLMFVKEDLIIPHFYTFQDFIVTKAMGKTGPLWVFDTASEILFRKDAAYESGEFHPVKIVMRTWYEKNKHIYPASRWEGFVPNKVYKKNIDEDLSDV